MRNLTAVIVAGGEAVGHAILDEIPESRWVVAADSGLNIARAIGLDVDVLIGDLDSADSDALDSYTGAIERHTPDKDHTDLELALRMVSGQPHIERLIVVGGGGGRLDHLLGNVAVLASPTYSHLRIEWLPGSARVHVVWDHVELHAVTGDTVSLIAHGGPVHGLTTTGLRWQLQATTLHPNVSLGISNEFVSSVATVSVEAGCLLTIQPEGSTASQS